MMSRTLSVHKEHELLLKLEGAGLSEELAQRVISSKDNELARKVVKFIQDGGFEPRISQKSARKIMGKNFFGIEEAGRYFRVNITPQQRKTLLEIPFSKTVLEEAKDSHILVAVFPLSPLTIDSKMDPGLFYGNVWFREESFLTDSGELKWQLVRKTPVENSTAKTWQDQQALIAREDEVPSAQVMAYTIGGYYLATGERLFERTYVRTSTKDSNNYRVYFGDFNENGLAVHSHQDDHLSRELGISSARKF